MASAVEVASSVPPRSSASSQPAVTSRVVRRSTREADQALSAEASGSSQAAVQQEDSVAWHPKLTPYRLVVLLTIIGIGTAKLVATLRGNNFLPITLEWIGGVVVFYILYFGGFYNSESESKHAPRPVRWMFRVDCMNAVWTFLSLLSVRRPRYRSEEHESSDDEVAKLPLITAYRFSLSFFVFVFGMWKAVVGYLSGNSGTPLAWLDWALGVAVPTTFYIIGLYENSEPNVWPAFFLADFKPILKIVFYLLPFDIITVLLCLGLIIAMVYNLVTLPLDLYRDFQVPGFVTFLNVLREICAGLLVALSLCNFVLGGLGLLTLKVESITSRITSSRLGKRSETSVRKFSSFLVIGFHCVVPDPQGKARKFLIILWVGLSISTPILMSAGPPPPEDTWLYGTNMGKIAPSFIIWLGSSPLPRLTLSICLYLMLKYLS